MKDGTIGDSEVEITVVKSKVSAADLRGNRHAVFTNATVSSTFLNELPAESVDYVSEVVSNSLEYLADNVDAWIENGVSLSEDGDLLRVTVDILVSDIDAELETIDLYTREQIQARLKELEELNRDDF